MHISWRAFQLLRLFFEAFFIIEKLKRLFITITLFKLKSTFFSRVKTKKLALTSFYCLDQETLLDDSWKLFCKTNQDPTISCTWENSKILNITSKYFSIFNNKPPASWVAHITRDCITCYSCSYDVVVSQLKNKVYYNDVNAVIYTFCNWNAHC